MPRMHGVRSAWLALLGVGILGIVGCSDPAAPIAPRPLVPASIHPDIAPGPYVPGQSYFGRNDYIEYIAGNAPVILSAPHGGSLTPSEIPDRTAGSCGGSATTTKDLNTAELVVAMRDAFYDRFGSYPHVIINHLHRRKLDANRDLTEGACGDAEAEIAWNEFQDFIDVAKAAVLQETGRGWYMDMHGHGHSIQRLELGYLLTGAQLRQSDATLDASAVWEDTSSIQTLSRDATGLSFSALLRGATSLGALYEDNGFPSVPSLADPYPESGEPYFSGGDNTRRHGCGAEADAYGGATGGMICGVQIEANYTGVRDNATNRAAFAEATAIVLETYLSTHWGIALGNGTGNVPPVADFTFSCADLACDFTDASTDADGAIATWSWNFGDGGTSTAQAPSHTYAAPGDYTVTLTVTDAVGAADSAASTVTVTEPSTGISLQATGYKVKGFKHADLTWTGTTSADVDIFRDGVVVATTGNDGAYTDDTGLKGGGSHTYTICEAGTSTCSNTATVTF